MSLNNALAKIKGLQRALNNSQATTGALDTRLHELRKALMAINTKMNGNQSKLEPGEKTKPTSETAS